MTSEHSMTDPDPHTSTNANPNADIVGRLDTASSVGTIEVCRGPHNFFNGDTLARAVELAHELRQRGARALVLCSEGRNFCAGADFVGHGGAEGREDVYELGIELMRQPLPMVVAMQGKTVGGGVGLAMVGDFRVASPESSVWLNFARIGLHHGFGLSATLPRVIGHQAAADLLLSGREIDGETSLRLGLCDRLTVSSRIRAEATDLAAQLAANAPMATQAIRHTLRADLADKAAAAMTAEQAIQKRLMNTDDFREGVAAVNERRTPAFSGT